MATATASSSAPAPQPLTYAGTTAGALFSFSLSISGAASSLRSPAWRGGRPLNCDAQSRHPPAIRPLTAPTRDCATPRPQPPSASTTSRATSILSHQAPTLALTPKRSAAAAPWTALAGRKNLTRTLRDAPHHRAPHSHSEMPEGHPRGGLTRATSPRNLSHLHLQHLHYRY